MHQSTEKIEIKKELFSKWSRAGFYCTTPVCLLYFRINRCIAEGNIRALFGQR